MKKILYIWKGPYPFEIRIQKICESLVNKGYDVLVVCKANGESQKEEVINGVKIFRAGFGKKSLYLSPIPFNPFWKKELRDIINSYKPDLIINREFFLMTETVSLAKGKIPILIDMAEHYPAAIINWQNYHDSFFKRLIFDKLKIYNRLEKYSVLNSKAVFTVCKENSQRLINKYKISLDDVFEVHNTPKLEWFNCNKELKTTKEIVFAYHGYLAPERNLENLLKAFDIFSVINPNSRLLICGSGTSFQSLNVLADKLKSRKRIELAGNFKHNDLCKLIAECNFGVLPYVNDEFINHTISNKLFDYFAMGKPVITSHSNPMRRIIDETQTGIYADCSSPIILAEAMQQIIQMDYKTMSENGIKAARNKYNWENDFNVLANQIERYI